MKQATVKRAIKAAVAKERAEAIRLADSIWQLAEPPLREVESSELLMRYMRSHGFEVDQPFPQMPTAFQASWGRGRPRVGVLAEYDALPNCGEKPGLWGHGCGHNLLGVGSAVAAVAASKVLATRAGKSGIVLWGCPAEETLAGKVYMARDGAFRDVDAAFAWHPGSQNTVNNVGGAALDSLLVEFFGRTAHGSYAEHGRSALDGVILLDVAVNYLREHVPENVRIHAIVRDGGLAPNVVPDYASSWYYVRGKDRGQVDEIRKRLVACARGAAEATGVRMRVKRLTSVYSRLPNDELANLLSQQLEVFGPPRATAHDARQARKAGSKGEFAKRISDPKEASGRGTSDEDNVSWLVPLGGLSVACIPSDRTGHHYELTAQARLPFAHKGMLRAAEILAASMVQLCSSPQTLSKIKKEFRRRTRGFTYKPLVPARQKPPMGFP